VQNSRGIHSGPGRGFTLIEIVIVVAISMLVLLVSVPSLNGVLADRRLHRSLDAFNNLVYQAQERSVIEHRAYLIVWGDDEILLRPEAFAKKETATATATFPIAHGEALKLLLPAALIKSPPGEWIFWPSGICEAATVQFTGRDGTWAARYSPLTARGELISYAAR
jgi:prepilin-type N-terminal cleavage/methylation domain-containing protein